MTFCKSADARVGLVRGDRRPNRRFGRPSPWRPIRVLLSRFMAAPALNIDLRRVGALESRGQLSRSS
jgi:hypothetical protein